MFHKIIAIVAVMLICIIIIFVVLNYFKNVFIFSVLLSSDDSPLIQDNDDNHFYIIDTDGQEGL